MLRMNTTNRTGPFYLKTEKVRIFLIKQRIKQVDLARQWGVTRSAVSRLIAGHVPYSPLLRKLAAALGVPLRRMTTPHKKQGGASRHCPICREIKRREK